MSLRKPICMSLQLTINTCVLAEARPVFRKHCFNILKFVNMKVTLICLTVVSALLDNIAASPLLGNETLARTFCKNIVFFLSINTGDGDNLEVV